MQVSIKDFKKLLAILNDPDFHLEDLKQMLWDSIHHQLGSTLEDIPPSFNSDTGWIEQPILLTVLFCNRTNGLRHGNEAFQVNGFFCHSIADILHEWLVSTDAGHFHYEPYELYWQPDMKIYPICVYGELYTSREFNCIHQELQTSP